MDPQKRLKGPRLFERANATVGARRLLISALNMHLKAGDAALALAG